MESSHPKVLIVDDDPMHLEIYGLLIKQAGYESVTALVRFLGAEIPQKHNLGLVLLDYRLNSVKTSIEFAKDIREKYPEVPIIVLSDIWSLPADIAPFVTGFVRKGEPAMLLETVSRFMPASSSAGEQQASAALD